MQWGNGPVQRGEDVDTIFNINFPIQFPNKCLSVMLSTSLTNIYLWESIGMGLGGADYWYQLLDFNKNGFNYLKQAGTVNTNPYIRVTWLAIGF